MSANSPIRLPKTTTASAPSRTKASLLWPLRLAAGDHRRQEDAGGHERGGDEEDRQLHVPGADQVVGEDLGDVDAEEAAELGAVVLGHAADQGLEQEQRRHHEEEPGGGPLGRGERHVAGGAEAERRLLAALPAEPPAPEGGEQDPDAAEQRDQRDHRPDDHVGARRVADLLLGRPVVRVGVVVAGAPGRGRPGRPGEERRQLVDLLRVVDRPRAAARTGSVGLSKKSR